MTFKCGAGYITISNGKVTATSASALRCKAKATVAKAARPTRCPYCKSKNISGGMGHWDCDDCGKSWPQ